MVKSGGLEGLGLMVDGRGCRVEGGWSRVESKGLMFEGGG